MKQIVLDIFRKHKSFNCDISNNFTRNCHINPEHDKDSIKMVITIV